MGAERVPSGAYLGDRDMFLFLVDGNRDLDDPTDGRRPGCSAASCSGTATSAPPPSPWMCSCFARCAAITSSGDFTTWPASGAGTWARRFTTRGPTHSSGPRGARRRPRDGSRDAPASHLPGTRRDARGGDRRGRAATGSVAEARRRRLHAGGTTRDEPAVDLGLRARTDATQSAHALAGRRFALDRAASRLLTTVR